jgi:hypothetical protein
VLPKMVLALKPIWSPVFPAVKARVSHGEIVMLLLMSYHYIVPRKCRFAFGEPTTVWRMFGPMPIEMVVGQALIPALLTTEWAIIDNCPSR